VVGVHLKIAVKDSGEQIFEIYLAVFGGKGQNNRDCRTLSSRISPPEADKLEGVIC